MMKRGPVALKCQLWGPVMFLGRNIFLVEVVFLGDVPPCPCCYNRKGRKGANPQEDNQSFPFSYLSENVFRYEALVTAGQVEKGAKPPKDKQV